jgi:hypothetical protein
MKNRITEEIYRILKLLANKLDGFYLAGGTALSLFYFHHRESYDLDFFTKDFSKLKIEKIIADLSADIKSPIKLIGEQNQKDKAKMLVYELGIDKEHSLRIDFVEDFYGLNMPIQKMNDIPVLSKEDIYLKKILTICGSMETIDSLGRKQFVGGRQDVKDFFDLYFLSSTFMPLSKFALEYCSKIQIESIIVWYNKYNREEIKLSLNDIRTDKKVVFQEMERHFKLEIEQIVKQEL